MLSKLINLLSKDKIYLDNMLANQLGAGERITKQLLHELARLGYVENIVLTLNSGSCHNCSSHCNSANFSKNRSVIWSLTEKGRQAAVGIYNKGD